MNGRHKASYVWWAAGLAAVALLEMSAALGAQTPAPRRSAAMDSTPAFQPMSFRDSVLQMLARREHPNMRWPHLSDVASSLQRLYAENNWRPLWSMDGAPTPLAASITRILQEADARGLSPADYDAQFLSTARQATPQWDVTMTVDVLRFATALRFGRVNPASVHTALHLPRDTVDLAAFIQVLRSSAMARAEIDTGSLDAWNRAQFDTLEPPWSHYWLLRRALQAYHEYSAGAEPLPSDMTPALAKARIGQIELALERWRWLPQTFRTAPIFINIPAFRLYAFSSPYDDGESTLLNMDVAVGKAYRTRTPVFSASLTTVIFSPYWDVPPSIEMNEILPKARRDFGYLARSHMEIVSVPGGRVLPLARASLARVPGGSARIRQRPGADNALGGVKFVFPNEYNVYLHDTPTQSVFLQARRDVSHGCIRVAEPARLAAFFLRDQPQWSASAIDSAMHRSTPQQVTLKTPVPVYVVYTTVIARADGQTLFYDDIYGHDRALAKRLARGYPYTP